jgi:hypothetical protein
LIAWQQVALAERLDQVAEHPRLDRARDELVLAVGGQHHDRDRPLVEDPPRRLDPVEARHLHVQHREVGLLRPRELDRLQAILRLRADLEPGALEQRAQVEPDDRLVLGDQDPHPASLGLEGQHPFRHEPGEDLGAHSPATTAGSACTAASVSSMLLRMIPKPRSVSSGWFRNGPFAYVHERCEGDGSRGGPAGCARAPPP